MKAAPGENPETALDQGQDNPQVRLFDPSRYSPVQVAIWQRLPQSAARVFGIASAIGSIRDGSGSDAPLKGGRGASGTLITSRRLPAVLQACGIRERMWRRHVDEWEARYVAHRCGRGLVFLFAVPVWDVCPSCTRELLFDHVPPKASVPRGPGFREGKSGLVPRERPDKYRKSGPRSTGAAVQEVPLPERESSPPSRRVLQGVEVKGEEALPGSKGSKDGLTGEGEPRGRGDLSTGAEVPPRVPDVVDLPSRRASKFGATAGNATTPCPVCGAKRADVGYRGHGNNCPRFYRAT